MDSVPDLRGTTLEAWTTNARVTAFLVDRLPAELWAMKVPGAPQKTVRMLLAHLHNVRCRWIKTLGSEHGLVAPANVDRRTVGADGLLAALGVSAAGIWDLLQLGCDHGGSLPESRGYLWRNLPLDVGHVLTYFVAHEAHHRGQVVMLARQLGHRLPEEVTGGLWQWSRRAREG